MKCVAWFLSLSNWFLTVHQIKAKKKQIECVSTKCLQQINRASFHSMSRVPQRYCNKMQKTQRLQTGKKISSRPGIVEPSELILGLGSGRSALISFSWMQLELLSPPHRPTCICCCCHEARCSALWGNQKDSVSLNSLHLRSAFATYSANVFPDLHADILCASVKKHCEQARDRPELAVSITLPCC